jgi:EAL domain-containing protein (putative c-di-GMP-specific phosphodiesterase class I)
LRDLGVTLVLDDFGTGYSSLSYLRHLPLDRLKIDRSFVTNIDQDPTNRSIVEAVVALGHGLGMRVVAEGIERPEEAATLTTLGCDLGQGYLWARPAPAAAMTQVLRRWQSAPSQPALPGTDRRVGRVRTADKERAGPKAGSRAAS